MVADAADEKVAQVAFRRLSRDRARLVGGKQRLQTMGR